MYISLLFIHSSVDGLLGYFYLLAIVNNDAMKIGLQIPVWVPAFSSLGYIPRSRSSGSSGDSVFNFLRNHHIIFHSSCTILHPHQQVTGVLNFSHPHQHLLFHGFIFCCCCLGFFFKIITILIGMKWKLDFKVGASASSSWGSDPIWEVDSTL